MEWYKIHFCSNFLIPLMLRNSHKSAFYDLITSSIPLLLDSEPEQHRWSAWDCTHWMWLVSPGNCWIELKTKGKFFSIIKYNYNTTYCNYIINHPFLSIAFQKTLICFAVHVIQGTLKTIFKSKPVQLDLKIALSFT